MWDSNPVILNAEPAPKVIQKQPNNFCVDLQMVKCMMKVNVKPNPRRLPQIYRNLGMDYDGRVLPSIANEVLKSVIARYTATQLINERDQVSARCKDLLRERLEEFNIEVTELALSEMTFGQEFSKAVE